MRHARIAALTLLALLTSLASTVRAETIDRVLAVAAGRVIMLSDVTAARELWSQPPPALEGVADAVRSMLSKLIDRELILAEVERYSPPEPAAEVLDRELAAVRARFPSPSAYQAALARSGVDEPHLRETLRQNLRIRAYEDQRFTTADPRREAIIEDWVASLRRRGDFVDLYGSGQ
jgi:hypothetical protein